MAFRFRRPSLLAPKASYLANSPLIASYTPIWRRRRSQIGIGDEADSDKEKMLTDSSPSSTSGNPTPPLTSQSEGSELELKQEPNQAASSSTMAPRKSRQEECADTPRKLAPRRFSHPVCALPLMSLSI